MMPSWGPAVLAVVASVSLGALFNWLTGRRKERRDDNSEERADESQDIQTVRGIASDTLARLTLAYTRLDAAETKAESADRRALALAEQVRALEAENERAKAKIHRLEEQAARDHAKIEGLENHNGLLTERVKQLERSATTPP